MTEVRIEQNSRSKTLAPLKLKRQAYYFKGQKGYNNRFGKDNDHVVVDHELIEYFKSIGVTPIPTPRSVYSVTKLFDSLRNYESFPDTIRDKDLMYGFRFARGLFAKRSSEGLLTPLKFDEDICHKGLSTLNTSAGLTCFGSKKRDCISVAFNKACRIVQGSTAPEPCIAYSRTQANDKTRLVWGYPFSMTIIESVFARPLIDKFTKSFSSPMVFGRRVHEIGAMLRSSSRRNTLAISLDYSKFDSSPSSTLISMAFKILSSWFNLSANLPGKVSVSCEQVWSLIVRYFVTSPIVMPDGFMYHGRRGGVPSGSYFTQIVDSIINVILLGTIISRFKLKINAMDIFVLGDDCLFFCDKLMSEHIDEDLKRISLYLNKLGFKLNPDKCEVTNPDRPHFLGRRWVNGIPEENLETLISKICYPERMRSYSSDPVERNREALLVLMSYMSEYSNFQKFIFNKLPFNVAYNYETLIHAVRSVRVDPDNLSGLMRYQMKYLSPDDSWSSLGTTFWK